MLTIKQEKFVQNLINGMSQREAYKNSYNASKMKDKTIDDKASLLFKQEEIRARYEELAKKLEDQSIMSAKERMKWLSKVVNGEIKEKVSMIVTDKDGNQKTIEQDVSSKLKIKIMALDTLNKMDNSYKQTIEVHNPKATKVLESINKQLGGKNE
ncbi:MAG: hypothetical protein HFI08_02115 [Bacilli bacterium]|jgi:phage terminase small subunit|nr:hypothetical protein [Bacilli bacterium]